VITATNSQQGCISQSGTNTRHAQTLHTKVCTPFGHEAAAAS